MSGAIAIFVKTPGISPVKTRLAVKLGREGAEQFHLAASRAVTEVARAVCDQMDVDAYYAVAEQVAISHPYWQDLPCLWQGEGGLGERMAHIYLSLLKRHDFVILVGADIPQMSVQDVSMAVTWLNHREQARLAFGPSADGGFWLFGGNLPFPLECWTDVTYSVADTGAQFLSQIAGLGELKQLRTLRDIDEAEDLLVLYKTLAESYQPMPAQLDLSRFLQALPFLN